MWNKNLLTKSLIVFIGVVWSNICSSEQLAPPQQQVIDEYGVNIATSQIAVSLDTVSIGGELGLKHNISSNQNNFVYAARRNAGSGYGGMTAFNDRFSGTARYTQVAQSYGLITGVSETEIVVDGQKFADYYVMRVHDLSGSQDFKVMVNGSVVAFAPSGSSYTYEALRDSRHKLTVRGEYLDWTKPDGTVAIFQRGANASAGAKGYLDSINYPNGYTITVNRERDLVHSVSTNTGYQLKYVYELDLRTARYTGPLDLAFIPTNPSSEGWSRLNPKHVIGINSSVEYCNKAANATCNVSSDWPKASFLWPAGTPWSLYFGDNTFQVVHPDNTTTNFYLEAQDLRRWYPNTEINEDVYASPPVAPRLAGIKGRNSSSRDKNYTYRNTWITQITQSTISNRSGDTAGRVYGAFGKEGSISGYTWFSPLNQGGLDTASSGRDFSVRQTAELGGILTSVGSAKHGTFTFGKALSNYLFTVKHPNGVSESFSYTRGNVVKTTKGGVVQLAHYADSCTAQNYKYCNSAEWIEDGKGNRTHYQYHEESGQTEKITYPPNAQGLVAETRYTYEQKFAKRKTSSNGNPVSYVKGIWLKTAESHCENSNYNNGCEGNDEIITSYEYDSDNLHLTSMIVESDNTKLRTCFAYDKYGNQISETMPQAKRSSCPKS